MTVAVYVPDLMDRSKIMAVAPDAVVVARIDDVVAAPGDIVIVDLSRPGVLDAVVALVGSGVRVVGFASHVDRDTLDRAHTAGCEVFARSAFFSRCAE